MRGIRLITYLRISIAGITPAHAGNTPVNRRSVLCCGDHPRACGEYSVVVTLREMTVGSPPRMRGIRDIKVLFLIGKGITPAHAGNTKEIPYGVIFI